MQLLQIPLLQIWIRHQETYPGNQLPYHKAPLPSAYWLFRRCSKVCCASLRFPHKALYQELHHLKPHLTQQQIHQTHMKTTLLQLSIVKQPFSLFYLLLTGKRILYFTSTVPFEISFSRDFKSLLLSGLK